MGIEGYYWIFLAWHDFCVKTTSLKVIASFWFINRIIVRTHITSTHKTIILKFPMLIAMCTHPLVGIVCISPFILKTHWTVGTKEFSISQFANDTSGLLDALRISNADVLGWSSFTYYPTYFGHSWNRWRCGARLINPSRKDSWIVARSDRRCRTWINVPASRCV